MCQCCRNHMYLAAALTSPVYSKFRMRLRDSVQCSNTAKHLPLVKNISGPAPKIPLKSKMF